jgi:hypothetical protein
MKKGRHKKSSICAMILRMIAKPTFPSLLGTTQDELLAMFAEWGETAYRAKQVVES